MNLTNIPPAQYPFPANEENDYWRERGLAILIRNFWLPPGKFLLFFARAKAQDFSKVLVTRSLLDAGDLHHVRRYAFVPAFLDTFRAVDPLAVSPHARN